MILFSDAVFAIAITLLAIEIKVPAISRKIVTDHLLLEALQELIPKFIGFFVSFFVIAIYWVVHHRTFGFVINYNHKLLWLNLVFLLAVVLMPFSSGFYSEYVVRQMKIPMFFYVGNIVFLGIMSLWIWNYVANPKHGLSQGITKEMTRYFRFRAMVPIIVFSLLSLIYLINPKFAIYLPLLIIPTMRLLRRYYSKSLVQKTN